MRHLFSLMVLVLASLLSVTQALAAPQDGVARESLPLESTKPSPTSPAGPDVDTIITNNKLRADTGSKSKYSVSTSLGYYGGSLRTPLNDSRPNISNGTGSTDFATLSGSFSARYKATNQLSYSAGIGGRMLTPLNSGTPSDYNGSKYDLDNPSASAQYLYRWAGVQSVASISETFYTTSNLVREGFLTNWSFGQNNVIDLGQTGISFGLNVWGGFALYSKRDDRYLGQQSDYSFGVGPALEYSLTPKLNLRTDMNLFVYEHIRATSNGWTFNRQFVQQNFGLGYAVARDFYLSPGLSFVPADLRSDRTTCMLSASINWF